MANSLGNQSIKLGCDGTALTAGLNKATGEIKGWGTKVQSAVAGAAVGIAAKTTGVLSNAKALGAGLGTAIGTYLGGPLGGAIGSAIGSGVGGIVETLYDAITKPFANLDLFGSIVKQSKALGVSASQFMGLQKQMEKVGLEGDAAGKILGKLGQKVAEGAAGGESAKVLAGIGLNAKELMSLPIDKQFLQIADAIAKLPPGGQQAAAAMKLFEEEGLKLLPMLQKGGSGITEWIEKAKKTGVVLSDSQLEASAEASKAWKEFKTTVSDVWDGIVNRATLVAAPIVKMLGTTATKAFTLLTPVFEWLQRAVSAAADIISAMAEVFTGWITDAIDWVASFVKEWFTFGDTFMTVEQAVKAGFRILSKVAAYFWDTLKAGAGSLSFVGGIVTEWLGMLVDAFKAAVIELFALAGKLPDTMGGKWFRDQIPAIEQLGGKIKKVGQDMRDWGKGMVLGFGESAKKVDEWFDRLDERKRKPRGGFLEGEIVPDLTGKPKYQGVAAMLRGSKEAYSVESRFRFENPGGGKAGKKDPQERVADGIDEANRKLAKIADKLGDAKPLVAA